MTDTYDKKNIWYGWNGGDCPVHPETIVTVLLVDGTKQATQRAGDLFGWVDGRIAAFTIFHLYREPKKPREWWVNVYEGGELDPAFAYESKREADDNADPHRLECVCFREVLPEEEQ